MKIAHQFILSCFVVCLLFGPSVSQARQCNAGMILSKTPNHPEGDCVPFRGKKVRMDVTQSTSKMGKSTESYLKPSSDNGPNSIQTKYLQLWLDATDPYNDGYRPANGAAISRWKDKSGNGHIALQATASKQPSYTVNAINGLPAVVFDGTSDVLNIAGGVLNKLTNQSTVFIVYSAADRSFGAFLQSNPKVDANNFGVQLTLYAGNGIMTNWYYGNGGDWPGAAAGSLRIDGGTVDPTIVSLVSFYDAALPDYMNVYYRGKRVTSKATASAVSFTSATSLDIGYGDYAGNPYYLNANIGEILIYNKTLTESERQDVEQYLSNKWSIKLVDQDESTAPVLLLDAQNNATINYNGAPVQNDYVGIWKDTSGFSNHAAGYGTARPFYKDGVSDTMGINGHPALYFTGKEEADKILVPGTSPAQFMTKSMLTIWPKLMEKFSTAMTTFIIAKTPDYGTLRSILASGTNCCFAIFLPTYDGTYTMQNSIMWFVGGDSAMRVPWTAAYNQAYNWAFRSSVEDASAGITAGKQIYQNGVSQAAVGLAAYTANINSPMQFKQTDSLRIAGPFWYDYAWKGSIGEIRMYNRRLSDTEMCSCSKHLQNKWSIAVEPTACAAPSTCTAAGAATAACACP